MELLNQFSTEEISKKRMFVCLLMRGVLIFVCLLSIAFMAMPFLAYRYKVNVEGVIVDKVEYFTAYQIYTNVPYFKGVTLVLVTILLIMLIFETVFFSFQTITDREYRGVNMLLLTINIILMEFFATKMSGYGYVTLVMHFLTLIAYYVLSVKKKPLENWLFIVLTLLVIAILPTSIAVGLLFK